jgi:hypothetical protein
MKTGQKFLRFQSGAMAGLSSWNWRNYDAHGLATARFGEAGDISYQRHNCLSDKNFAP